MTHSLTKTEAQAFRARWQLVNAREEEELRSTSMEVKWQQFNTLLLWAQQFGWTAELSEGESEVRQRWGRLRKAYRGKKANTESRIMKRTEITYGQLEQVLRGFGFTCRPGNRNPPGRIYEHPQTGATVAIPAFPESDKVYEHHLLAARLELENFGIADPVTFDAKLQKAG